MLSVIVPVYNTAKYLPQCLDSILAQTYRDIEVIVVNDASPDNSIDIIKKYAEKDCRVVLIDKKVNEGVDSARFSGLKVARGERVTFVDSDDWLLRKDIFEIAMGKCDETDADYVEIRSCRMMDKYGLISKVNGYVVSGLLEMPELFDKYYLSFFGVSILEGYMWGKFYKKEVIDRANLIPSGLKMQEDFMFNWMLFPYLKKIYRLDVVGYAYRFGGMTSKYNPHLYPDLLYLFKLKLKLIKQYDYWKAKDYAVIEIKNVLMSDVQQMIQYKVASPEGIKKIISDRLKDDCWSMLAEVKVPSFNSDDPVVAAILDNDADGVYEIARQRNRAERPMRCVKKIVSRICGL